uniref:Fibrinogen C domain-containing protein 1-like n=1 Tax=Acanthochromis polyacanthus TaxID=80966 RepID=A0A3Q1FKA7_9TELE
MALCVFSVCLQRCCSVLLWSVVTLVVIAAAVTTTMTILYLNQGGVSPPVILTNPKDSGALVTVSRVVDGEPISIFLDPNCPDFSEHFVHWEALQSSLLTTLSNHNTDWQERGLLQKLGEELKGLAGHAHNLRLEADSLKRGQGVLNQQLDGLQSDQSRIIQVLSDSHAGVMKLTAGFSDSLLSLQREMESLRRLKSELSRESSFTGNIWTGNTQVTCRTVWFQVFQRREDGSVNFFRGWDAYRDGFGTTNGEHWLGLQRVHSLTRSGVYELRIDMSDFDNATAFAHYSHFSVGRDSVNPEEDGYPLEVEGYSGTAGDSLLKHSGMQFTTKDRDQDQSENNCAAYYQGAWWYRNCHTSNLNGQYLRGGHASYADGVEWSSWTGWQYSLRFTEMKVRPSTRPKS